MLTYFVYAPLLVLVFLGSCRLLFGKSPLCKQKSSVQDVQPSTTSVVLFLCQAARVLLTYLCTFRSLSSPSSTCAPCSAFGQRLTRDTVPPFAIFNACSAPDYLFVSNTLRSAPRPRLSRLLPFALWQDTSLQAKKQCSRRTTKARRFAVLFDIKSVDKRCVFRLLFYIRGRG